MIYATRSRWVLAIVLAVLGAFWFEVDFSSSHPAASDAAIVAALLYAKSTRRNQD